MQPACANQLQEAILGGNFDEAASLLPDLIKNSKSLKQVLDVTLNLLMIYLQGGGRFFYFDFCPDEGHILASLHRYPWNPIQQQFQPFNSHLLSSQFLPFSKPSNSSKEASFDFIGACQRYCKLLQAKFRIWQQKFIEQIADGDTTGALQTLRKDLAPMQIHSKEIKRLSGKTRASKIIGALVKSFVCSHDTPLQVWTPHSPPHITSQLLLMLQFDKHSLRNKSVPQIFGIQRKLYYMKLRGTRQASLWIPDLQAICFRDQMRQSRCP